jgi:hypothetical protein
MSLCREDTPHRIVSDVIGFMDSVAGQNFALEISFPEPHNPIQVPKPYFGMYPPEQVPERLAGPEALKAKGFRWQWMHRLEEVTYQKYDKSWRVINRELSGHAASAR